MLDQMEASVAPPMAAMAQFGQRERRRAGRDRGIQSPDSMKTLRDEMSLPSMAAAVASMSASMGTEFQTVGFSASQAFAQAEASRRAASGRTHRDAPAPSMPKTS